MNSNNDQYIYELPGILELEGTIFVLFFGNLINKCRLYVIDFLD